MIGQPKVEELPQQFHAVLGESFHITCTATNDQDAPVNLMFYWGGPNGVQFNVATTNEDDSLTAASTLHISNVTRNHGGVYQCTVSNGEHQRNNIFVITKLVVEGKYHLFVVYVNCTTIYYRAVITTYKL